MINEQPKKPSRRKIICKQKTKVQQAFRDLTLAKNIYKKYENTGMWSDKPLSNANTITNDVSNAPDLQEYYNKITQGANAFVSLGSEIVSRFQNPLSLLDFLSKEENRAEAQKLGLLPPTSLVSPQNLTQVTGLPVTEGQVPPTGPVGEN